MVTKSWAQVAALPGGKAKRPVQTPTLEPSEAVDSGRSIDDAGLVRQSESPGIKVTGAQPKANTDGAHLDNPRTSACSKRKANKRMETTGSNARHALKLPVLSLTPISTVFATLDNPQDTLVAASDYSHDSRHHHYCTEFPPLKKQNSATPIKTARPGDSSVENTSIKNTQASSPDHQANKRPRVSNSSTPNKHILPHECTNWVASSRASVKSSFPKSTNASDNKPSSPASFEKIDSSTPSQDFSVINEKSPDVRKSGSPDPENTTQDSSFISTGIQDNATDTRFTSDPSGDQESPSTPDAELLEQAKKGYPYLAAFDCSFPNLDSKTPLDTKFQVKEDKINSPTRHPSVAHPSRVAREKPTSTRSPSPITFGSSLNMPPPSANSKGKEKEVYIPTRQPSETSPLPRAAQDSPTSTPFSVPGACDNPFETPLSLKGKGKEKETYASVCRPSAQENPTRTRFPGFNTPVETHHYLKSKGKEKETYATACQPSASLSAPAPNVHASSASKETLPTFSKTIVPGGPVSESSFRRPSTPVRAKFTSHRRTSLSFSSAGPSGQNINTRVGRTSYPAVPDIGEWWPHDSGLTYKERNIAIKNFAEAVEELARAQALQLAEADNTDVIIFTEHSVDGRFEMRYHREIIVRDSAYMARVMPPPNEDGSPVTIYMGNWPIRMIRHVFDFMYEHKIIGCKPPEDDMFYHMSPTWLNYHCYLLGCAFETKRQQYYHLLNLKNHVHLVAKQISGDYAGYQLAYWEFSQCEEALRDLVRIAFKETGYQEAQRPMRVLVARLVAIMVPWLLRGRYMAVIIKPLWFEMKEEYLPWREMMWHYIATGEVQRDDWKWLGDQMSELQITTALLRFGVGF